MILKQITLSNFRNYENASFDLNPAGNLIIAPNGYGKTNLLEAMAYCGLGKSVHFHRDEVLLRDNTGFFSVKGVFVEDTGMELQVQISWENGKKLLKINSIPVRQLSRIYECVKVIYAAPEDMNLVGGNPRFRRQHFDLAISQIYPQYISTLRNYLHVVEQRNNLLKTVFHATEKLSWDLRFAELLLEVMDYRRKYLGLINQAFMEQYPQISDQVRDIHLRYITQHRDEYPEGTPQIMEVLAGWAEREKRYQRTLLGAHLDDYAFQLEGHNLKNFGSQGQKRITVIILKLIHASLIEKLTQVKPILLFDDVFAELDAPHANRISELVDYRYQVFVASPREDVSQDWKGLQRLALPGIGA